MTKPVFHFDNYVVRPVTEQDREYITLLIENDPFHTGRMDADFFLKLQPGEDAWAIENQHGQVQFYFKTQTACRVSMIFAQGDTSEAKTKNRIALMKGLAWIEAQLIANSFREILFDTEGPELKKMAKRRMGFLEAPNDLRRPLTPPRPQESQINHWDSAPQVSREGG